MPWICLECSFHSRLHLSCIRIEFYSEAQRSDLFCLLLIVLPSEHGKALFRVRWIIILFQASWILSETIWKLTWIVWADFPYQECPFFALLVLSDNFGIILVKIHTACHSSIILCLLIWAKSAERESGLKWTLSEQKSAGQNLKTLSIYFIGQRWLLSQELSNFQARNYLQNSFKYHLFALLTQPPLSVLQAC